VGQGRCPGGRRPCPTPPDAAVVGRADSNTPVLAPIPSHPSPPLLLSAVGFGPSSGASTPRSATPEPGLFRSASRASNHHEGGSVGGTAKSRGGGVRASAASGLEVVSGPGPGDVPPSEELAAALASPLAHRAAGVRAALVAADAAGDGGRARRIVLELIAHLGIDRSAMSPSEAHRVYEYYLPVALWVLSRLDAHHAAHEGSTGASAKPPPHVVGLSAPQGCGKTTLVEALVAVFEAEGLVVASLSVDDLYLTRAEQVALAEREAGNPLLELRGNAGSHDVALGARVLEALTGLNGGPESRPDSVALPRYDKSLHAGKGDRAHESSWPTVTPRNVDLVLLEGWMLGFRAVGPDAAAAVHPGLAEVDRRLAAYEEAWDIYVGSWVTLQVGDPTWSFAWRLEAEHAMIARGQPGMSDDDVRDFCERFQPAYRAYLPGLYGQGPTGPAGKLADACLAVPLGRDRSLLGPHSVCEGALLSGVGVTGGVA